MPPGALPAGVQLSAQLGELRTLSAEREASGSMAPGEDFADVVFVVEGRAFRSALSQPSLRTHRGPFPLFDT